MGVGRIFSPACLAALAGGLCVLALVSGGCRKHAKRFGPLRPCKVPRVDEELLCGQLTVFENREPHTGRTIDLKVVVLPALDGNRTEAPLFHLEGGPGVAATGVADFYAKEGSEYRSHRDVVLVDQRGTGESNPLTAPARTRSPQDYLSEMYPVDYVKTLRETLEKRADLTQYTTSIAMDDLDDVRAWLGYERINLVGLSYGTRAVLVYMRQHPDRVRSAILMGVAPTYLKMPLHHARAAKRAIDLLFAECAAKDACHHAFPDIEREWEEVLARLGREPARVEYFSPDKSGKVTVEIQRDVFAEKIRNAMYSRESAARIPLIIHRAAQGDAGPFLREVIPADRSRPDSLADGMYLSVTCAEDVPFIDQEEAARANAGNPFGNYRVVQQTRACELWPRGKIPGGYHGPVDSKAPVLILSGQVDPVTPPANGEEVASHLPNSRHIVVPHGAHGPFGLLNVECLDKVMLEFLARGDAKELDTSCVDSVKAPPFVTDPPSQ
ncbi:MAG TPA: alpha/beta hydrolase [Chthoniobacterales bacterium]|nr:alpha/beta hydrolase [Chthoniobacterales bacterium]